MKTTLDLPADILDEAVKASGEKTKTATIVLALQNLIRREKMRKLRAYRGKIRLDADLDALRSRA